MKIYEIKGVGKVHGMTVMSLDAFVRDVKPEKEVDESDISGLIHAAKHYNKAFLITADLAEGGRKTYRVRAQSERVAREKFSQHFSMAKVVSVKEEGIEDEHNHQAYSVKSNQPNQLELPLHHTPRLLQTRTDMYDTPPWQKGVPEGTGRVDELTFKGSTCTRDCSGHEAGYQWWLRKKRVPNSHSRSFNNGADIASNESEVTEAPGDFGLGAKYRNASDDEMQAFLSRVKDKEKTKRDKFDYPYVHGSNIQIKNEEGHPYDLDSLRKQIMIRPAHILGQNAKMQHSGTGTEAIFDIGLPALKGLAVNEKTGQFVIVDTCPGAGACKTYCYAMKGSYVMFKAVSMGVARVLNFLLNDPEGFANLLNAEIATARYKMARKGARMLVRWHDAGDFFSPEYLDMAYGVADANPDVGFYAYTKIASVATGESPKNFNMNFSQGAVAGQEKKIDFKRTKHSKVVPKHMFFDLVARKGKTLKLIKDDKGRMQFATPDNLDEFKTRMSKHYAIDKDSILTYDQMMGTPIGDVPKWNVIVMPGDGDNSANRNDVIGSYLLFH